MAALTPAARAAQQIGCSLILQLDTHLAELALDPEAKPTDAILGALAETLAVAEKLIVSGKGGGQSVSYALAHVAPQRETDYEDRDLTKQHARVTHSLRVLQSLYGPQVAPGTCEGGC